MPNQETWLAVLCPACGSKYEQNPEYVCPFCGYELISVPYAPTSARDFERHPELYLEGMLTLISFLPYFKGNPRIETDPRIRPDRALPSEIRQFRKTFFGMGLNVHAFNEVIEAAMKAHPKGLLDPFSLDIRGLRAILTLIFQREKGLGLGSVAVALNKGFFLVVLQRLQFLLAESGVLAGRHFYKVEPDITLP